MLRSALIIDADGKTPDIIKGILGPYGFEFTVTENGPEAVNMARTTAPDIIFVRAELPLTSGFSVCNRLRRHAQTKTIPLIIYSSNVSQEVFEQHRNLRTRANDYIKMPLIPGSLVDAVRPIIAFPDAPSRPVSAPEPAAREPEPEPSVAALLEPHHNNTEVAKVEAEPPPPPQRSPSNSYEAVISRTHAQSQQQEPAPAPEPDSEPEPTFSPPPPPPEPSSSGLYLAEDSESSGQFRSQREVLQLKSQLNARKRELLAMTDELEDRERAILDAKRKNRELQSQAQELESQLLAAQEQVLGSREQSEALARDKATLLKREEGLKNRLEGTQRKVKELEAELTEAHTQFVEDDKRAQATISDLSEKVEIAVRQYMAMEKNRDELNAQLSEARAEGSDRGALLEEAKRKLQGLEAALEDEKLGTIKALEEQAAQHKDALDSLAAEHEFSTSQLENAHQKALDDLIMKLEETKFKAAEEQTRLNEALKHSTTESRGEIERLTAALSEAETSARDEIKRLSDAMHEADIESKIEIERLGDELKRQDKKAKERARVDHELIESLQEELAELKVEIEATRMTLRARNESGARAQQALAVALKLLEHHTVGQ